MSDVKKYQLFSGENIPPSTVVRTTGIISATSAPAGTAASRATEISGTLRVVGCGRMLDGENDGKPLDVGAIT